jgi:hypothetical protein
MSFATLNEPYPIRLLASDGRADLYGQARIYDISGTMISTVSLTHINEGMYGGNWSPSLEGHYSIIAEFYLDSGHSQEAGYERSAENIEINTIKPSIARILGLQHENARIDAQTYDGMRNLLTARVRTYDSPTNADAGTSTGLVATYQMTADYNSEGLLIDWRMTKLP